MEKSPNKRRHLAWLGSLIALCSITLLVFASNILFLFLNDRSRGSGVVDIDIPADEMYIGAQVTSTGMIWVESYRPSDNTCFKRLHGKDRTLLTRNCNYLGLPAKVNHHSGRLTQ